MIVFFEKLQVENENNLTFVGWNVTWMLLYNHFDKQILLIENSLLQKFGNFFVKKNQIIIVKFHLEESFCVTRIIKHFSNKPSKLCMNRQMKVHAFYGWDFFWEISMSCLNGLHAWNFFHRFSFRFLLYTQTNTCFWIFQKSANFIILRAHFKKWALLKSLCRPSIRPSVSYFSAAIAPRELKFWTWVCYFTFWSFSIKFPGQTTRYRIW
jgi:hypothetical protein